MPYGPIDAAYGPAGMHEGLGVIDRPFHYLTSEGSGGEGNRRCPLQSFGQRNKVLGQVDHVGIAVLGRIFCDYSANDLGLQMRGEVSRIFSNRSRVVPSYL